MGIMTSDRENILHELRTACIELGIDATAVPSSDRLLHAGPENTETSSSQAVHGITRPIRQSKRLARAGMIKSIYTTTSAADRATLQRSNAGDAKQAASIVSRKRHLDDACAHTVCSEGEGMHTCYPKVWGSGLIARHLLLLDKTRLVPRKDSTTAHQDPDISEPSMESQKEQLDSIRYYWQRLSNFHERLYLEERIAAMATQIENALVEHSNCQALNLMEEGDIMCTLSKQQICKGTQILKKWLKGHIHKPYPTTAEKEQLAAQTGNSLKQINYWFINARRRYVPKMKKATGN